MISLEENINFLEQYGRRNNLQITRILDDAEDQNLEEKIIEILDKIDVNESSQDIEACHRIGKSKKLLIKDNRTICKQKTRKKALGNRKGLKNIDRTSIGLEELHSIFINENLTAFH